MEMNMNDALKAYFDKEGVNYFKATEIEPETLKEAKRFVSFIRGMGVEKEFEEEMDKTGRHYQSIEDFAIHILMRKSNS